MEDENLKIDPPPFLKVLHSLKWGEGDIKL